MRYPRIAEIFIKVSFKNKDSIFNNIFTNDEETGESFAKMLANSILVINEANKVTIAKEIELSKTLETPSNTQSSLKSIQILDYLIGLLESYTVTKSWSKIHVFLYFFANLTENHSITIEYLLEKQLLLKLLDFYLQEKSPLFKVSQSRVIMGNSVVKAKFYQLFRTFFNLLRFYRTPYFSKGPTEPEDFIPIQGKEYILGEAESSILESDDFYKKSIEDSYCNTLVSKIIGYMSFENLDLTKRFCKELLDHLNANLNNGVSKVAEFLQLCTYFLSQNDTFAHCRLVTILGGYYLDFTGGVYFEYQHDFLRIGNKIKPLLELMIDNYSACLADEYMKKVISFYEMCLSSEVISSFVNASYGRSLGTKFSYLMKLEEEVENRNALSSKSIDKTQKEWIEKKLELYKYMEELKTNNKILFEPYYPDCPIDKVHFTITTLSEIKAENVVIAIIKSYVDLNKIEREKQEELYAQANYYSALDESKTTDEQQNFSKEAIINEDKQKEFKYIGETLDGDNLHPLSLVKDKKKDIISLLSEGLQLIHCIVPGFTFENVFCLTESVIVINASNKDYRVEGTVFQVDNQILSNTFTYKSIEGPDGLEFLFNVVRKRANEVFPDLIFDVAAFEIEKEKKSTGTNGANSNSDPAKTVPALPQFPSTQTNEPIIEEVGDDELANFMCNNCFKNIQLKDNMINCPKCHRSPWG